MKAKQCNSEILQNFRKIKKATSYLALLTYILSPATLFAQGVSAAKNSQHSPSLDVSDNGVPVVNINAPSKGGVSRNEYDAFNVNKNGLILNNSPDIVNTKLAGHIDGNANLNGQSASIILNEVIGNGRSYLNGYTEVAGQSAEVVIANQNGITCNGCGFINTTRGVLTTGDLMFDGAGTFTGYQVSKGDVDISGLGLNATNLDQVDILARSIQVNGELWANQLNLITGLNTINHDDLSITERKSDTKASNFSLDVAAIGGMYANRIKLIGTEKGLGVNLEGDLISAEEINLSNEGNITNQAKIHSKTVKVESDSLTNGNTGEIATTVGSINLAINGELENSGKIVSKNGLDISANTGISNLEDGLLYSESEMKLSTKGKIENNSSKIQSKSDINLVSKSTENLGDSVILAQNSSVSIEADKVSNESVIAGSVVTIDVGKLENQTQNAKIQANELLSVNANDSIKNKDGSSLLSQGKLELKSNGSVDNSAKIIAKNINISTSTFNNENSTALIQSVDTLSIDAQSLSNSAKLVGNKIDLQAGVFLNSSESGLIKSSDSVVINVDGDIDNLSGAVIYGENLVLIDAVGKVTNSNSGIYSQDDISINSAHLLNLGDSSAITSNNGDLSVTSDEINNQGILSALTAFFNTNIFSNTGLSAQVKAKDSLDIKVASDFSNNEGALIYGLNDVALNVDGNLDNGSKIISEGDVLINTAAFNNTKDGLVYSKLGKLDVTTHSMSNQGLVSADTVNLNVDSMVNQGSSAQIQAQNSLNINITEEGLSNLDGANLYAKNTLNLEVSGAVKNEDSVIRSSGDISIISSSLDSNEYASIIANSGNLTVDVTDFQNLGLVQADSIDIYTQNFLNSGVYAQIQAISDLNLSVSKSNVLNKNGAVLYAGNNLIVNTPNDILNDSASIQAGNDIGLDASSLNNSNGSIIYSKNASVSIDTNKLTNTATIAGKDISIDTHQFSNSSSSALIQASNTLTVDANSSDIINQSGATLFGLNKLVLNTEKAIKNLNAYIQSALDIVMDSLSFANDKNASVISQNGLVDINVSDINNQGLLIGKNVDISTNSFKNTGSNAQIQASDNVSINASSNLYNQSGALIFSAGNASLTSGNNFYNQSSIVETGGNLNISAKLIQNEKQSGGIESYLFSSRDMNLTGNFRNNDSILQSGRNLNVNNGYFLNTANGVVKAKEGTATFGVSTWTNYGFIGSNILNINASGNLLNQGDDALVLAGTSFNLKSSSGGLTNKDGGVLYSFGNGSFDINGHVLNESSTIETQGRLDLKAGSLTNKRDVFKISYTEVVTDSATEKSISRSELPDAPSSSRFWYANVTYNEVTQTPYISEAGVQGTILSGGSMTLDTVNDIRNEYSTISAAGNLNAKARALYNFETDEEIVITTTGTYKYGTWKKCRSHESCGHKRRKHHTREFQDIEKIDKPLASSTLTAGGAFTGSFKNLENGAVKGIKNRKDEDIAVNAPKASLSDKNVSQTDLESETISDVTDVGDAPSQIEDQTNVADTYTPELEDIDPSKLSVDLSNTDIKELSNGALFSEASNTDHNYLIETNSKFTEYENFISSDYMLEKMGINTKDEASARLGDGYLEQKIVRDQIIELTGKQYVNGSDNTESQYIELMENALAAHSQLQLSPGVALTAEQIKNLDEPIVWMVEQEFQTKDGVKTALVPKVYFTNAMQMLLREDGALISGNSVSIDVEDTLANAGSITSQSRLDLTAKDIENSGKLKAINQINLIAERDVINQSGSIESRNVNINAGRDFINETKVDFIEFDNGNGFSGKQSFVGDTASIAAESFSVFAGNDINLIGSDFQIEGDLVLQALGDIALSTSEIINEAINGKYHGVSTKEHIVSKIGAGSVLMIAGDTFTAKGAKIASDSDVSIQAKDINLLAVKDVTDKNVYHNYGGGNSKRTQTHSETVIGTEIGANGVLRLNSEGDITSKGSQLSGTQGIDLSADGNILLATEEAFNSTRVDKTSKKSGVSGSSRKAITSIDESLTHTGTSLNSNGNIILSSGNDISLIGSDVNAGQHIGIDAAGDLLVSAAVNESFNQYTKVKKGSLTQSSQNKGSNTQEAVASNLNANGSMSINSGGNVAVVGSNLSATDTLTIGNSTIAKDSNGQVLKNDNGQFVNEQGEQVGNVSVTTQELTNETWNEKSSGLRGVLKDIAGGISLMVGTMTAAAGIPVDAEIEVGRSSVDRTHEVTQQASNVQANDLGIDVQGDVAIIGSNVNVDNQASINANSFTLDAAKEQSSTHHSETVSTISSSGPSMGENEVTLASMSKTDSTETTTTDSTTWSGSTLNAGTLSVNTAENVNIISSDVNVTGDAQITAKDVIIGGRQDVTTTTSKSKEVVETVSVGVKNAYADTVMAVDALNDAKNAARDAKSAYDNAKQKIANGEMPASELKYFEANMAAATINVANATLAVASAGATAAASTGTGGFYATGSASVETNESSSTTTDKTWNGSNLNIGGNANITADNEIQVKGSNIAVTGGLQLDAKDINLVAGDNSSTSTSDSSSHSENASYSTNGGPSGSLSASETESTSESNYYTNTQIAAGTLSSDSENLTLSGANVDAGVVDITTGNLLVESLQNTSTSNSETKGANVGLNGSGTPTSGGINQQVSESSTAWVDQQSSITGGDVTIKAKDTTIKGGLIAAVDENGDDNGQLSFATDTLSSEDLQDHSTSSDKGFNLNTGEGSTTVGANYSGHDTEQTTKATIGNGNVTVGGDQLAEGNVNRDVNNSQEITKDHELGGLDATVTVDHRLATEEGRQDIANDFEDTAELAKDAGQTVADGTDYVYDEIQTIGDNLPEEYQDRLGETGEEFIDELIQQDWSDEKIAEVLATQKLQDGLAAMEQSTNAMEKGDSSSNTEEALIETFVSGQEVDGILQLEPQIVTPENVDLESPTPLATGLAGLGKVKQEIDSVREDNPELAKGIEVAIGVATGGPLKEGINQVTNAALENIYGSDVIDDVKNKVVNHIGGAVTGDKEAFEPLANIDKEYPNSDAPIGDSRNDIRDGTDFALGTILGVGGSKGGNTSVGVKDDNTNSTKEPKGGTYVLRDAETEEVRRTGRSKDLEKREQQHANTPETEDLVFEVDRRTDDYSEQRGREHIIHEKHPEAKNSKHPEGGSECGLNKCRAISPTNPKKDDYLEAEKIRAERDDS
ncbi:MAG: hemagglutinin repeat-containing protein [Bermanella sp.]